MQVGGHPQKDLKRKGESTGSPPCPSGRGGRKLWDCTHEPWGSTCETRRKPRGSPPPVVTSRKGQVYVVSGPERFRPILECFLCLSV